jgi:hypothetical protein
MGATASIFAKLILDATEYTKGLNKSKTDTNTFTKQGKSALGGLGTAFQSVTGFSLGTAGAIGLASAAMAKAIQYTKQAIELNDAYVSSIVDMARFTGDNTDAMSRMVQVADDVFLSQEALNNAMSIGAKKGLDMSVQGIKDLADQYNALATPQEKAKLLNDNFGRSGLEMGKLLEMGAAGITANMQAVANNLVVTDQAVLTTYEYKQSVDALNDSMDGIKYTVAQNVMPIFSDLNIVMAEVIDKTQELEVKNQGLSETLLILGTGLLYPMIKYYELLAKGVSDWADKIRGETGALDANTQATLNNAVAKNILAGTSRGSIYNPEYSGTPGTTRGSIYGTPKALGGSTIAGSMSQINERGIPEMVSVGNKDYLTMGSQNGTVTPLSNAMDSSNTDTMIVNALLSVMASNEKMPKAVANAIRQLEKYQK